MITQFCKYLEDTGEGKYETTSGSDEEHGSDIEHEGDRGVGDEDQWSHAHHLVKGLEAFCERYHG